MTSSLLNIGTRGLAAAISELQSHQTGLEAALKAYATISRMGLFQALG